MDFVRWVQTRLNANGFKCDIDGIWGRETQTQLIAFQNAKNLSPNGKADEATVLKLRYTGDDSGKVAPKQELPEEFPWMQVALRKKGLREDADNKALRQFLKSDGKTLGDPAKLPWCGDFGETCIALALPKEKLPINPYLARNWLKFGTSVEPCYGAIMVFKRGGKDNGTSGHVCFYYAEDATHFHVLGGNQSNTVSVTRIAKGRLLGARMPLTGGPYRRMKVRVAASGAVSTNEA